MSDVGPYWKQDQFIQPDPNYVLLEKAFYLACLHIPCCSTNDLCDICEEWDADECAKKQMEHYREMAKEELWKDKYKQEELDINE